MNCSYCGKIIKKDNVIVSSGTIGKTRFFDNSECVKNYYENTPMNNFVIRIEKIEPLNCTMCRKTGANCKGLLRFGERACKFHIKKWMYRKTSVVKMI